MKYFANGDYTYCRYMKTVEVSPDDEHTIVQRSESSLSCAWCVKHKCPCKDLGYYCSSIDLIKGHWDENMNWIEEKI